MSFTKTLAVKFCVLLSSFLFIQKTTSQIIISQYYEGTGTNKWIELTNLGTTSVNTASPQLQLGLWAVAGSTGNIVFSGSPTNTIALTVTIPAKGSVLIGNSSNGTEVPYLTAASAAQQASTVINFNGNDGIALLDAAGAVLDRFGTGINATDISYVRSTTVTAQAATYTPSQWTSTALATVQAATSTTDPNRLGAHLPPACATPTAQPTALVFSSITSSSFSGSFTSTTAADEYLVVRSTLSTLSANPVDGTVYNAGNALGGGTVVSRGTATSFSSTGLNAATTYYHFIFSIKSTSCSGGPKYRTTTPLSGNVTTLGAPCTTPSSQPTTLTFNTITTSSINGAFTATTASEYLVVRSTTSSLSSQPVDGTVYNAGNALGGGTVVARGTSTIFSSTGLVASTTYYFFVYAINSGGCSGGPKYLTASPLTGSQTTTANTTTLNYYFGNLHAHSSSSDGNKEDVTKGPADDYAFAKTALCMDFLGISEHNHTGAGMHLVDWQPGRNAAATATASNFVAMYGMEWGVISGGGHVIVYGMDSLIGWEPNEYQIFVAKSVYTGAGGLFEKINNHGSNALAYLAHPNSTDFNNLAGTAYNAAADNAVVGSTVESGPAFSTTTNYTNPSTMTDVGYYRTMLSKGYHLGPTIDHDNHYMTFGKTAKTRLVILAPSLSENNLLQSMRQMKFYASEDCGAGIDFKINNQPIGSIFTGVGAPVITVGTTTTSPVNSIIIYYGVPGSGTVATSVATSTTTTLSFTHTALANLATGYYYADITETDGTRILTSPIWYTRNDAANAPASITSLFTINENNRVVVKWTTQYEEANQNFIVERSIDGGKSFEAIGANNGMGNSPFTNMYSLNDDMPVDGLTLYRLVQKSSNDKTNFTDVRAVNRALADQAYLTVYPNPVHGMLAVKINAIAAQQTTLDIYDMSGRKLQTKKISLTEGEQTLSLNMQSLTNGTYFIKTIVSGKLLVKQVVKM